MVEKYGNNFLKNKLQSNEKDNFIKDADNNNIDTDANYTTDENKCYDLNASFNQKQKQNREHNVSNLNTSFDKENYNPNLSNTHFRNNFKNTGTLNIDNIDLQKRSALSNKF